MADGASPRSWRFTPANLLDSPSRADAITYEVRLGICCTVGVKARWFYNVQGRVLITHTDGLRCVRVRVRAACAAGGAVPASGGRGAYPGHGGTRLRRRRVSRTFAVEANGHVEPDGVCRGICFDVVPL